MKIRIFVAAVLAFSFGAAASAQSIPDDVHCLVLSNVFAKNGADPRGRQAAAQALLFYLGRLDGRADAGTLTNAMRAQGGRIDSRTAATQMSACAARVAHAEQTIQILGRAAAPAPGK